MSLFSEIEKTIERGFHRFAGRMFGPAEGNELLLLHRAILAEWKARCRLSPVDGASSRLRAWW